MITITTAITFLCSTFRLESTSRNHCYCLFCWGGGGGGGGCFLFLLLLPFFFFLCFFPFFFLSYLNFKIS